MAFPTVEQVRAVEWSSKYLWDVSLDGAPAPFNQFFPATDVMEELAKLNSYSFEAHIMRGKIPKDTDVRMIQVTYVDDAKQTLATFISNWINKTILNDGLAISSLENSVKSLQVVKLTRQREQVSVKTYWVYPEGTLSYEGSSTGDAVTHTTSFVIVGAGD